ncbi:MAG TPA: asparagine synthase-related protein [Rhodothermales bacterium]
MPFPAVESVVALVIDTRAADVDLATIGDSVAVVDGEVYDDGGALRRSVGLPADAGLATLALTLWHESGEAGLSRMNGQAAVILWDDRSRQMVMWRDRTGIPPLFYVHDDNGTVCSTEISTLLALGCDRSVDTLALDAYLSFGYIPAPWTLVKSVRKMLAAHAGLVGEDGLVFRRGWNPVQQPKLEATDDELRNELRSRVETSLRRRSHPGKPIGVMLSGGVDSSLLVAALARWVDVPVEAFTFSYEGYQGALNEYDRARLLTQHLGIPHHILSMNAGWVADQLPTLLRRYEEPFTFGLHSARLDGVLERGIGTMLSGGFSGFPSNWELPPTEWNALRTKRLPPWVQEVVAGAANFGALVAPGKTADRLRTFGRHVRGSIPDMYEHKGFNTIVRDAKRRRAYADPRLFDEGLAARKAVMAAWLAACRSRDPFDQLAFLASGYLSTEHVPWWNHRWGRANGIRFRHPYCDLDLVEFFARIPRAEPTKRLLREVAAMAMPQDVARYPKLGQGAPIWVWLQLPGLRDLVMTYLTRERVQELTFFDASVITQAVEEHMNGTASHPWLLWTLLCYAVWHEMLVSGTLFEADAQLPSLLAN